MVIRPRLRRRERAPELRRVRLHLLGDAPSVDGLLETVTDGHYLLRVPRVIRDTDASYELTGHLEVPVERVAFVQVNP